MSNARLSPNRIHAAVRHPESIAGQQGAPWHCTDGSRLRDDQVADWTPLYSDKDGNLLEWVPGSYGSSKGKRGGVVLFTVGPNLTGPGYTLRSSLPGLGSTTSSPDLEHLRSVAEVAYRRWLAQTGALAV